MLDWELSGQKANFLQPVHKNFLGTAGQSWMAVHMISCDFIWILGINWEIKTMSVEDSIYRNSHKSAQLTLKTAKASDSKLRLIEFKTAAFKANKINWKWNKDIISLSLICHWKCLNADVHPAGWSSATFQLGKRLPKRDCLISRSLLSGF